MQNFLRFLSKFGTLLLFVLLEGFALYLLFSANSFQRSVFLTSANSVIGKVYSWEESFSNYFNLKYENEALINENIALKQNIAKLKTNISRFTDTTDISVLRFKEADEYRLIPGRVIKNSVIHVRNYMTLNVGKVDGVKPEMGVANDKGIVGVVSNVSDHYSVVIPILNPEVRFSCKLKSSGASGSLVWDETDRRYAMLEEIPPYVHVNVGDTIVTSGYSSIFPEGLMVGIVEEFDFGEEANFLQLKVKLAVRFDAVSNVSVVDYKYRGEARKLENQIVK